MPRRHFTRDKLGSWCRGCGMRLPRWMSDAGEIRHPCCSAEFEALRRRAAWSRARRIAAAVRDATGIP